MTSPRSLRRISSSEARATLALLLESVGDGHERVLIERRGKSPVALVSVEDMLRFQLLEGLEERRTRGRK
jgi:prevent-host-death family protein